MRNTQAPMILHLLSDMSLLGMPSLIMIPDVQGGGRGSRHTHMYGHLSPVPTLDRCFIDHCLCFVIQDMLNK